jgi:hypothetical protein
VRSEPVPEPKIPPDFPHGAGYHMNRTESLETEAAEKARAAKSAAMAKMRSDLTRCWDRATAGSAL